MTTAYSHRGPGKKVRNISLDTILPSLQLNGSMSASNSQMQKFQLGTFVTKQLQPEVITEVLNQEGTPKEKDNPKAKGNPLQKILPVLNYGTPQPMRTPKARGMSSFRVPNDAHHDSQSLVAHEISQIPVQNQDVSGIDYGANNNQSHMTILPSIISSQNLSHLPNVNYALQAGYIDHNPHFMRYNKSISALDKLESSKITLSREFYHYPDQREINVKFKKEMQNNRKQDQVTIVKLIKDNVPETIELLKEKSACFKLYVFEKVFPLTVSIQRNFGSFEIFVSKIHKKPDLGSCEYYMRNDLFQVDYSGDENVRYVYIRVSALERVQMTLIATFASEKEAKNPPLPKIDLKKPQKKLNDLQKRKIYEFFHENMGREELLQFKQIVDDIRQEKKEKARKMGSSRNAIMDNMMLVPEYDDYKQQRLLELTHRQAVMFHNNKVNRLIVEKEKEKKQLYNTYKYELRKLEREWIEGQERERNDKIVFQKHWIFFMTLMTVVDTIYKKKRQMRILKKLRNIQNKKAKIIQQKLVSVIHRPLLVKFGDKNHNIRYKEDIRMETKIMTKMCEALNALVQMSRPKKKWKAENLVKEVVKETTSVLAISDAMNRYLDRVVKIQKQWRSYKLMFEARIFVFKIYWDQFCMMIIDEESKKKKKKMTEQINKIREAQIDKYGREWIRKRLSAFLEAAYGFTHFGKKESKVGGGEAEASLQTDAGVEQQLMKVNRNNSQQDLKASTKSSNKDSPMPATKPKLNKRELSKANAELDIMLPQSRYLRFKPSKEDLKEVFEAILQEMRQDTNS